MDDATPTFAFRLTISPTPVHIETAFVPPVM
jgi:hypothetical protein